MRTGCLPFVQEVDPVLLNPSEATHPGVASAALEFAASAIRDADASGLAHGGDEGQLLAAVRRR